MAGEDLEEITGIPRVSGGEPGMVVMSADKITYSPRERG